MNKFEKYHFDLEGYIVVKGLLTKDETARYLDVANQLEAECSRTIAGEPTFRGQYNIGYYANPQLGVLCYENMWGGGRQIVVDDCLNASSAFDALVGHEPTMRYIRELSPGPYRITSSEMRFRYKNNKTLSHMGGPVDSRNRYEYLGKPVLDPATGQETVRHFNLLTARVIYALHDIPIENGPLSVVPGSHKANFFSPYGEDPSEEPGMIGVPMEAGDALFFTENLRHGGLPNQLDTARKTIHIMICPRWATSQSPAHEDGDIYVSPQSWQRYSAAQRELLPAPSGDQLTSNSTTSSRYLEHEVLRLKSENERLAQQVRDLQSGADRTATTPGRKSRWLPSLFR